MRSGTPPEIYRFMSYRAYLRAWFSAMKTADHRFSHRLFARRAGVRSPSLLGEVIAGRRNLSTTTLEGFIGALQLSHEEALFFSDLVRFDQASTANEKNAAWERIAACRRFRSARPLDAGLMRYLSNWYYPATRELAWRADFQADPQWISATLLPRISLAQARDALDTLLELGLLIHEGDRVRPRDSSLVTPHQIADLAGNNYHRQMLHRAAEAIETVPTAERHLCAVTVAIPEHLVPTLKAELDAIQERLLHLCDQHLDEAARVYQINLQLVPLSRPPGEQP